MKKTLITILATVLVCCCVVGGTLAWLVASTQTVTNTFTVGNVSITLTETGANADNGYAQDFKMIPGNTINKDPKVTVAEGSEKCWLFVKVEKANNPDTYLDYSVDSSWKELDGVEGVYYIQNATAGSEYPVLTDNKVTVKSALTAADMAAANANKPGLKFTAYAAQADNLTTAAAAWNAVQNPTT